MAKELDEFPQLVRKPNGHHAQSVFPDEWFNGSPWEIEWDDIKDRYSDPRNAITGLSNYCKKNHNRLLRTRLIGTEQHILGRPTGKYVWRLYIQAHGVDLPIQRLTFQLEA